MSRITEKERQTLYKQFQEDITELPLAELKRFRRKFADAAFSGKTVTGDLGLDTVCASHLNRHHDERKGREVPWRQLSEDLKNKEGSGATQPGKRRILVE